MTAQGAEGVAAIATYALVELGTLKLGIDTRCVVQALPRPTNMTPLHRTQGALDGVFSLRGQVVPVVNLQKWLSPAAVVDTPAQVLVLRSGDKVIGLAVDAVRGLLKVTAAEVQRVHHDDEPHEFFHSVVMAEDKTTLISLLDPERLMAQAQAWSHGGSGNEAPHLTQATAHTADGNGTDRDMTPIYVVVRLGSALLAFTADVVGEILAMPQIQKVFGSGMQFLGMTSWRGRDVPVADMRPTLGLPAAANAASPWLLVLGVQGRCMGLPVDDIRVVRPFPLKNVQPPTATDNSQADLYLGTVVDEHGDRIFLLDGAALIHHSSVSAMRLNTASNAPAVAQDRSACAHVVFRAGLSWAAPMDLMLAITHYPASLHRTQHECPYMLGSFEWRGQALPLLDLRQAKAQTATEPDADTRVIVIQVAGRLAGLVVEEVNALIPAHTGTHTRFSMGQATQIHMVTLGHGDAQKSYQVLDFTALSFFNRDQSLQ